MPRARPIALITCAAVTLLSCGGARSGDVRKNPLPDDPAGGGLRLSDIGDPASPDAAKDRDPVAVTGVVVVAVDDFDETNNGRSRGAVYVQDIGSTAPYSGLSLFSPTFVPSNLKVGPGDVLDIDGELQENKQLGATRFPEGAALLQLAPVTRPEPGPLLATFRYEHRAPEPVDIDIRELADFATGRKWLNMLVRVRDVTVQTDAFRIGPNPRVAAPLLPGTTGRCDDPFPRPPTLVNELTDFDALQIRANTRLRSVVGVVTFFCNLHIAPRSPADIQID